MKITKSDEVIKFYNEGNFTNLKEARNSLEKLYALEALLNIEDIDGHWDQESRFQELLEIVRYLVQKQ